jgi:anti-sigma factor (TIGR02949 family)
LVSVTARLLDAACKDVLPLLDAAADGELLDDDRAVVRAHLASCTACRARMDATQGVKAALRAAAAAQEDLPAGLEDRVRAEIRAESSRHTARNTALFVSALSAAAALAWVLAPAPAVEAAFAPDEPMLASLVERHALDVPVDVASPDPARVSSFLSARVGEHVDVPRLDDAGYGLEGARVVDVADGRGAQLVYRGGLGERLTLMVMPDHSGALRKKLLGVRAVTSIERAGHRLKVWHARSGVHALVGQLPSERLDRVASSLTP